MADSDVMVFPCKDCGGKLQFQPGADSLRCPYCGSINAIQAGTEVIEEKDFYSWLDMEPEAAEEIIETVCGSCGAHIEMEENVTSGECPFCGSKIVAQGKSSRAIKPESVLPFKVTKKEAAEHFKAWIKKRWFAPGKVKKFARMDGLNGIYTPYWTYDCGAHTDYTGQRGEYYYVTESYTATEDGKSVTKTRQVRKTRWYGADGSVDNEFDDVLVLGADSIPSKLAEALEPWDLENLVPYKDSYLSGFRVEGYSVNLKDGFVNAGTKMDPVIRRTIERAIGGDEQRILSMDVKYSDIKFKHILLPVWISAYRFKDKIYQFLVNARTGEVQGRRPWSAVKIISFAAAVCAVIGTIIFLVIKFGG